MYQLPEALAAIWQAQQFTDATPIQQQTYQLLREGKSIVAIAPTGTGKTLAYLLPTITHVTPKQGLQLLILAPSQELAQQIGTVISIWAKPLGLSNQTLIGSANISRQIDKLKMKPEIIVATPGRFLEIYRQTKKLKCHLIKSIILDEADYLLTDEHIDAVREIIRTAPSDRQVACFSATNSERLETIARWINADFKHVEVTSTLPLTHCYIDTPHRKRVATLRSLAHIPDSQAIIFVNQVATAQMVYEKLNYEQITAVVLHSDLNSEQRKQAIAQFTKGHAHYLITTDVASRGLDIPHVPCIIHYDLPRDTSVYHHRSGRAGRMGTTGIVISLTNEQEQRQLLQMLSEDIVLHRVMPYANRLVEVPE